MHRHRRYVPGVSFGSYLSSPQENHDQIPTPVAEEAMSSCIAYESPTPTVPLPNEKPTRPATRRARKKLSVELDPLEGANPHTPVQGLKWTKSQAKWSKQIRTHFATKPLPPLQETLVSPISISSEEEQVEPMDDVYSPHPPPSITEEPLESFPKEYRTPSVEAPISLDTEFPVPGKEQWTKNEKIQLLKEQLTEAKVLERYLKAENARLKD